MQQLFGASSAPNVAPQDMPVSSRAVWPALYHLDKLSPGLRDLDEKSVSEQAAFWRDLAGEICPDDANARLPPKINSDFLGRYFDATEYGAMSAYTDTVLKFGAEDGKLRFNGLVYVLGTHYGLVPLEAAISIQKEGHFIKEGDEIPDFSRESRQLEYAALERFWKLVSSDGDHIAVESFDYVLRRLRIGWMLANDKTDLDSPRFGQLYHYDYNESNLSGSMSTQTEGSRHFAWHHDDPYQMKCTQVPVGGEGSDFKSTTEFLYDDPSNRGGNVHWVHLHEPSNALIVMVGQMYGLGIHCLSVLCRLPSAQAQYLHSREWKFFTFPAVHLDRRAKESLKVHQRWKNRAVNDTSDPPELYVGAYTNNLGLVWHEEEDKERSAEEDRNYHTAISVTSKPAYLGMWTTNIEHRSTWSAVKDFFSASRQKDDKEMHMEEAKEAEAPEVVQIEVDTAPKTVPSGFNSQKDSMGLLQGVQPGRSSVSRITAQIDEEAAIDSNLIDKSQEKDDDFHVENGEFQENFDVVLRQLSKDYSVLRMGNHRQLVFRILLDRATGYWETVKLYTAAVHVLQYRLKDPDAKNKDVLISKISHAKLELETLVRMAQPFVDGCLKNLVSDGNKLAQRSIKDSDNLSARLCRTNLIDIEHNLKSFLETARTQIQLCEMSITQYDREAADQSNSILNFLTIITFLVMPVQMVTGWYGMNFAHMPELKWSFGYHYAFFLSTGLFALFLILLQLMRSCA